MKTFKAAIFDLDGTLLNTLDDLTDSMNAVLASLGFPTHLPESYKYFIGEGINKLAIRALPADERSPNNVAVCVERMIKEYGSRWADKTTLYPGVTQLLDKLQNTGVTCAIFSNKPDNFTRKAVNRFLNKWHFAEICGAQSGIPKKPDPAGAIAIAKRSNISAQDFVYVGDTNIDMLTAVAAKMYPVGALWGFRTKNELINAGAETIASHPLDILKLFRS